MGRSWRLHQMLVYEGKVEHLEFLILQVLFPVMKWRASLGRKSFTVTWSSAPRHRGRACSESCFRACHCQDLWPLRLSPLLGLATSLISPTLTCQQLQEALSGWEVLRPRSCRAPRRPGAPGRALIHFAVTSRAGEGRRWPPERAKGTEACEGRGRGSA
ncbi:unnamed protein product [Rangifer tarandus platyrhynchus]|uniref:Uncharacterized protein n=1 Tax=Rangifer tarandus platyrhynchus TaxID=3082113 RepID=A0ABN8XTI3_RANTA|nr:unnamed protein product [Rangifer tarandus platyrhynchus]